MNYNNPSYIQWCGVVWCRGYLSRDSRLGGTPRNQQNNSLPERKVIAAFAIKPPPDCHPYFLRLCARLLLVVSIVRFHHSQEMVSMVTFFITLQPVTSSLVHFIPSPTIIQQLPVLGGVVIATHFITCSVQGLGVDADKRSR